MAMQFKRQGVGQQLGEGGKTSACIQWMSKTSSKTQASRTDTRRRRHEDEEESVVGEGQGEDGEDSGEGKCAGRMTINMSRLLQTHPA